MVVPFPKPSTTPPFSITKIPSIMRALGWDNGAIFLDKWFAGPPNDDPTKGTPDTTTIEMDKWALTFSRAKSVYDQLMADKVWINKAAQDLMIQRLVAAGKITNKEERFGETSGLTMPQVDDQSINFRPVTMNILGFLDGLDAALGAFTFKVLAQGRVGPSATLEPPLTHRVNIDKVGVYIKDSFDFNGPQFLGSWRETPPDATKDPLAFPPYVQVNNVDFRNWRTANNRGGDFLIFSDIKWTTRIPADSFSFNGGI
jgi:hypothetical protein